MQPHYFVTDVVPGVVAAAYANGDAIGTMITIPLFPAAGTAKESVFLQNAYLMDDAEQSVDIDLALFNASFTAAADNAAFTIAAADKDNFIGFVTFTGYRDFGGDTVAQASNLALAVGHNNTIYGQLVSRGTPTYANAADLRYGLTFARN